MDGWMQAMEIAEKKSVDARAVRLKNQLPQKIVYLSLIFTHLQSLDYVVFQRLAQLLGVLLTHQIVFSF